MPIKRKLVIVGDEQCGKTSLLRRFAKIDLAEDLKSNDGYFGIVNTELNGKQVKMELYDTACQEDYNQVRPYTYMNTNIMLIIFSLINRKSFEKTHNKWIPEVKHFSPDVPIILVGNKKDLRNDQEIIEALARNKQEPIRFEEGMALAKNTGAFAYMECSARTNEDVGNVFENAVRAAMQPKKLKRSVSNLQKCCLF